MHLAQEKAAGALQIHLERLTMRGVISSTSVALALALLGSPSQCDEPARKNLWEASIARMEADDQAHPVEPGGIVFVGSSSIRLWDLAKSFPDLAALNRGFGGSHLADSVHFADRIVTKYHPRLVVVYAGDNDLAAGKSPETIAADYAALVARVHGKLPEAKIIFLAVKHSPARRKLLAEQKATNRLIAQQAKADPRLVFLDVATPLLDAQGEPRPELFLNDGLHLNEAGYAIWAELLRPLLN